MFELFGLIGFAFTAFIFVVALHFVISDYIRYRGTDASEIKKEINANFISFVVALLILVTASVFLFLTGFLFIKIILAILIGLMVAGGIFIVVDECINPISRKWLDSRKEKINYAVNLAIFVAAIVGNIFGIVGLFL